MIESEGDSEAANSGAESGSLARFREDLQSGRINVEEELPYSRVKQRRRGRKKKSLNELDLMRQAAVCQPSDTVGLSTAPIPPKKRGRGRPRKHPVVPKPIEQMPGTSTEPAVNYSFESDSQPVATPEKKRRGRKPLPKSPSNLTPPSSRKRAAESNTPVQ